jgi:hypothetical protein
MGLYSRQFFYGHPKLERYEEYALKDSPDLDRRFLANIDAFAFKNEKGVIEPAEYSVKQGYEMRAAIFDFFQGREKLRSTFVEVIAQTTGRKYTAPSHIGDQDYVRHSLSEKIRARFRKDRLRTTDIEEWLKTPENQTKVTTLFTHITRNKITLLTQKAKLQGAMHSQIMGGTNNGPPAPTDITDFKERAEFAEAMCSSYDKTIERIAEHNRALKRLQHIATSSGNFAEAIESVMALDPSGDDEKAKDVAKSEPLERRLAAYLIEDMPAQYNHNRGKLLEIEAQASKHAQHHFRPIPR